LESAKPDTYEAIAKDILANIGKLLATRPYIAITDAKGTIQYTDAPLEIYAKFIQSFVNDNFHLLQIGDHSLPLGGVNLAFFKMSSKSMVILYTVRGVTGQLLSFKARMPEFQARIDQLIGGLIEIPTPIQEPHIYSPLGPSVSADIRSTVSKTLNSTGAVASATKAGLKTVPFLMRKLTGKEKFPLEDAQILQFCDGTNGLEDICAKTGYNRLKVDEVIRDYQKKKWIELKRIVL